jgi:spore germination cell wall hydrolase CwlJ-like protein
MVCRSFAGLILAGAAIAALLAGPTVSLAASTGADDAQEIGCLALTIYHEARGESERGKLAVGHVVMNRAHSVLFPASVCDVVREGGQQLHRCQFSWWCDGRSDRPKDQAARRESLRLAEKIYYGCTRDPTAGALWYHSTAVKPSWSKSFGPGKRIDRHVFYRGDPNRPIQISVSMTPHEQCPRAAPVRTTTLLAGS